VQPSKKRASYIAADSPTAGRAFVERIVSAAESLQSLAHRGRQVQAYGDPAVRELLVHPFRLIYRIGDLDVLIVTLVHEARDSGGWSSVS
jgi:plasmid stabilization system protein ParE